MTTLDRSVVLFTGVNTCDTTYGWRYGSVGHYGDEAKRDDVCVYPMIQGILTEKEAAIFLMLGTRGYGTMRGYVT